MARRDYRDQAAFRSPGPAERRRNQRQPSPRDGPSAEVFVAKQVLRAEALGLPVPQAARHVGGLRHGSRTKRTWDKTESDVPRWSALSAPAGLTRGKGPRGARSGGFFRISGSNSKTVGRKRRKRSGTTPTERCPTCGAVGADGTRVQDARVRFQCRAGHQWAGALRDDLAVAEHTAPDATGRIAE
jgi:hypothetical protein